MKYWVWLLPLVVAPAWGVMTIAPVEVGSDPGVSGKISGSYVAKSGNTDKHEYDVGGRVQYDSDLRYVTFLEGAYERTDVSDVRTEDEKFGHARYLQRLASDVLYGELFAQYKDNIFKGINTRWLGGGNLRWRFLSNDDWGRLYLGVGAFHEKVDYIDEIPDTDESTARFNSYLAYTHPLTEQTMVSVNGYYQPAFEDADDHYLSGIVELTVNLVSQLDLSVQYEIEHDSAPPEGVEKEDREFRTSLVWNF